MAERKQQWIFLFSLLFVVLCSLLATNVSDLLISLVTQTIPFATLQNIQAIYNVILAFSTLLWGYLVDRFPFRRKLIFIASAAVWIVTGVLLLLVPQAQVTPGLLLGIYVVWGLAIGANGPVLASYLGDLFRIEQRGRLFAAYTTLLYLIRGFALVGNGFIGYPLGSWTIPISIFALVGVGAVLLFWRLAPEPQFGGAEPELDSVKYAFHFRPKELKPILKRRSNILFILQGISGSAGVAIVTKYLQYWLTATTSLAPDAVHVDPYLATIILGVGGAIGALCGIFLTGFLADRAYKNGKITQMLYLAVACLFLEIVAYAVVLLVPSYPVGTNLTIQDVGEFLVLYPIFIAFIVGFNIATFFSTPIGTTVDIARTHLNLPEHRGTVQAIYNFAGFLGSALGIYAANLIFATVASYRLTIVYGTLFWLISGAIWILALFVFKKDFGEVREILQSRGTELSGDKLQESS